ncbi:MAG: hypothetical protein WC379_09435 [Methanoregula sp.]
MDNRYEESALRKPVLKIMIASFAPILLPPWGLRMVKPEAEEERETFFDEGAYCDAVVFVLSVQEKSARLFSINTILSQPGNALAAGGLPRAL